MTTEQIEAIEPGCDTDAAVAEAIGLRCVGELSAPTPPLAICRSILKLSETADLSASHAAP